MKDEPKSRSIKLEGKDGIWISKKRARCLFARAKIGRKCRSSCFTAIANYEQADKFVQQTVETAWINYSRQVQHQHRQHVYKIQLVSMAFIIAAMGTGFGVGMVTHAVIK
jgi:hypothetical protein